MGNKKSDDLNVDIWMPVIIGDFLKATIHLSTEEVGALFRLQMHYWSNGGPFPDDDKRLSRITGQSISEWQECKGEMIGFFEIERGLWVSQELDETLKSALKNRKTNKERSKKAADASVVARTQKKLEAELQAQHGGELQAELKDKLKLSPSPSPSSSPIPLTTPAPIPKPLPRKDVCIDIDDSIGGAA